MAQRRKKLELHLRQTVDDFPEAILDYRANLERTEGLSHTGEVFKDSGAHRGAGSCIWTVWVYSFLHKHKHNRSTSPRGEWAERRVQGKWEPPGTGTGLRITALSSSRRRSPESPASRQQQASVSPGPSSSLLPCFQPGASPLPVPLSTFHPWVLQCWHGVTCHSFLRTFHWLPDAGFCSP